VAVVGKQPTTLVPLTQGQIALIDDADEPIVAGVRWKVLDHGRRLYAVGRIVGSSSTFYMHRLLLDAPPGSDVDHLNGDGLDNRRENLRLATRSQNLWNSRLSAANKSGYKGVAPGRQPGHWRALLVHNQRTISLGQYDTPEEAARAYDARARELHGAFARCNFPEP